MNKKKRKVRIRLESRQEDEVTVHDYEGEWIPKPRSAYVLYEEREEGQDPVRTTVRIGRGELTISRRGHIRSEQRFIEGLRQPGAYSTPGIQFKLETVTEQLTVLQGDHGEQGAPELPLDIAWSYTLWMNGQHIGRFQLRLQIQEVDEQ
ncbi:DUF1934 domain-containing protein [Paenibacillus sp. GCM10012307]|uniref:DUF1934 domain-containing protein n=1 Tax=Paenibacillus roseus TaxID=2798579 RepID=A0A934IWN5_9BACL|nr:DUF1934 domain-containing protein [Paenibacillus roseus]MBJ6360677.1 DUF1934 domain-containing protein [Paenibacillus roseus]